MTAQHEHTDWVCRTADLLVELRAQPAPASRTLLWAAAGLRDGELAAGDPAPARRFGKRAWGTRTAVDSLGEAWLATHRLVNEEPGLSEADRNRLEAAEALLDDADAALRATLGLPR